MVKKAHFVTGKGGVGKSLVAAVLARHFSQKNQHLLLAELSEFSFYKDFLDLPQIRYTPTNWTGLVDVAQWSAQDCLREYALHLLKIQKLYELFFENPVTRSLVQVAPGVQELAILGKVTSSPRRHGPPMSYDQLVIDAFATGHFLSLLQAPKAMADTIPFGPMGDQSRSIDKLIRDPNFTEVHVVSLAEELPITETLELYFELQKTFQIKPKVYLNKLFNLTEKDLSKLDANAQDYLSVQAENELKAKKTLQKNQIEFISLPLVTTLNTSAIIDSLLPYVTGVV
ncbi:MAG: arsenical pump-driving ATPase [Bdellovibrio sp.]|nr:arsenical pump-driving ATPase [Bdellovibrio sp.]